MDKVQTSQPERNGLWTYKQVAVYLGVSESKAKRLPIPRVKLDRSIRFFPEKVKEWAEGHSIPRIRSGASNG